MSAAASYSRQAAALAMHVEMAPGIERLRALAGHDADLGADTIAAVLDAAARFAAGRLSPLNSVSDCPGCRLAEGRVRSAPGFAEAWREFGAGGWIGLDLPCEDGGMGLPLVLQSACQEMFDRGCVAFGMLAGATRAAARLIAEHGDSGLKEGWLPRLASGEWAATICISEADAGSDVARIRTRARQGDDGAWRVSGEKTWISFGDHDMAARIGHCLLARTGDSPGTAGLSLFLVPDTVEDGCGGWRRNAIFVRRLEHKLGLHGSPTCALGFEDARAHLLGEEGRGLAQLFTMIRMMRLTTALQGVAVAAGAAETALAYAGERRQGGPADAPPLAIDCHADVQRQLMAMAARVETVRGLVLALAAMMDLARLETDAQARREAEDVCAWLLPIAKDFGGGTGFAVASQAIQVLGGAGYTREWPLEQHLRDSRVFTVYEGTTGIQALDLLHRRLWRQGGRPLRAFEAMARREIETALTGGGGREAQGAALAHVLALQADCAEWLMAQADRPHIGEAGATSFLQLAALAATGWIALRLARLEGKGGAAGAAAAASAFWLSDIAERGALLAYRVRHGASSLAGFDSIKLAG